MRTLIAGFLGLILSCSVAVGQSGHANVNVNVNTQTLFADAFTEVTLSGVGGGTVNFFDLATAPGSAADALALALVSLGLPSSQDLSSPIVSQIGSDSLFGEVVSSNYNPVDDPDFVIGFPDDYLTWIAIGTENVIVSVEQTTTEFSLFSIRADIISSPTPVPLPASGLLLVAAIGAAGALARRKRA